MEALAPLIGVVLMIVAVRRLRRLGNSDPPETPEEAIGELFRGPPLSVIFTVFVFALGLLLVVVPLIFRPTQG